jgi:hypothetical protein
MLARSHIMSIDYLGTGDALGPTCEAVHGSKLTSDHWLGRRKAPIPPYGGTLLGTGRLNLDHFERGLKCRKALIELVAGAHQRARADVVGAVRAT